MTVGAQRAAQKRVLEVREALLLRGLLAQRAFSEAARWTRGRRLW